jgi:hypothetical protein
LIAVAVCPNGTCTGPTGRRTGEGAFLQPISERLRPAASHGGAEYCDVYEDFALGSRRRPWDDWRQRHVECSCFAYRRFGFIGISERYSVVFDNVREASGNSTVS